MSKHPSGIRSRMHSVVRNGRRWVVALMLMLLAQPTFAVVGYRDFAQAKSGAVAATTITATNGSYGERTSCGSVNPSIPGGSVNDLLIAQVVVRDDNTTVSMGANWQTLFSDSVAGQDYKVYLFWRKATNTGADTNTVTQSGTCDHLMSFITRFGNVDPTTPLETQPLPAGNWAYADASVVSSGTQSVTAANSMLVLATFGADNGTVTEDSGFTQIYEQADGSGRDAAISLNTRTVAATGSYGPFTNMAWSAGTDPVHGVLFAVRPAPSVSLPTLTIARPAGTTTGDVMVATIGVTDETVNISAPSGWSEVQNSTQTQGGGDHLVTYVKAVSSIGGEPADYTWTFSAGHSGAVGGIIAFSGVDNGSPVVDSGAQFENGNATTHTAPSVTATANNMLVTSHSYSSSGTWTPPGGMTERVDIFSDATTGGGGVALEMNHELLVAAGATGTRTATASGSGDEGVSHALALRPTITTTTLGDGANPGNVTLAPGASITDLDAFTLQTNAGTDSVTGLTVTLSGANAFESLSEVRITNSAGTTTYFSAVTNPASNTVVFSGGTPIPVATSAATFKVRITPKTHANMPVPPGASYVVGGTVTAFTSTNAQAGTDGGSATITVDNESPASATSASAIMGSGNAALNWTTSVSGDFATTSGSVIYRWAAASAGSEVPAEGTTPGVGSTNGTATVACVVSSAASTGVSQTDGSGGTPGVCTTATLSGPNYSYKVFQKDSRGNYGTGVTMGNGVTSGGCALSNVAGDVLVTCTGNGTFTPPAGVTSVRYLMVAGGGGGGGIIAGNTWAAGGGGAGGLLKGTGFTVTPGTPYTITVGASGAPGVGNITQGGTGGNSVFSTLTASGGGGGASRGVSNNGDPGGSGGGGRGNGTGGAGVAGQGNNGGDGAGGSGAAGGGGGASAVGATGSGAIGGNGGAGTSDDIAGAAATYAGGGGGGGYDNTGGSGGAGGGGSAPSARGAGIAGAVNTGGGGGGATGGASGGAYDGGAGGSGIVILRYTTGPVNCTSLTTGNWSAPATWTQCRGGIPLAGDTVTIASGHAVTQNVDSPAISTLTISGTLNNSGSNTLTVNAGMVINSTGTYTGGSGAASITGDFSRLGSGTFTSGSGTWTFNGSSTQTVTGATTFTRLTVNNAGGITLNNNVTVSTLLTLNSGNITTGSNALITSTTCPGSISRTSGHVVGNLTLRFPVGATTCTFPVGSGTAYAPITVTPPGGSAGGTLTGSTTGNEHPDIAASGIDSSLDANRYWTLGAGTDTIVAGTYDITFSFIAGDLDAAATPGSFIIGQVAGSTWTLPGSLTATSTSIRSSNIVIAGSSFNTANSFVAGERVFVCGLPSTFPPGVASWPVGMSCVCDNFARGSLNPSTIFGSNFQVSTSSGSFGLPRIVNPGYLQMTDDTGNVATAATLPGTFPAAGNLITVEFKNYAYNGSGADGIALTLSDASVPPAAGAFGGSLGYAQKTGISGFAGGWVGVGLDEWGNFSANTEGRTGGAAPGQTVDSVAVRGSGAGTTGYPYMAGTTTLSPGVDNAGSATPAYGHLYRIMVDARGYTWNGTSGTKTTTVSVERDTTGTGGSYTALVAPFDAYVVNATQANVPGNWALSFTGSTGGSTNIHELTGLKVCAQTILPPSGYSILVDNLAPTTCASDPRPTVTVKPLDANGQVVTTYINTVTLSAKLLGGGAPAGTVTWAKITGGGVFTPSGANATYTYVLADNGVASFSLDDNTQEDLYITVTETPGSLSSTFGSPVKFSSGVASFVVSAAADALGTGVVAGRAHLMSITRNKSTCGGGTDTTYTGSKALDGWYAPAGADHPAGALAPQVCAASGGTCLPATGACQTLSIAPPAEDPSSNFMPALTFANGVASFCLVTSDVGKYSVNLRDDSVATGTPSVTGATSNLTVRPFAVAVRDVTGNPADNTATGSVFTTAGTSFSASVQAYLWQNTGSGSAGWGDANGDGLPDVATLAQISAGGVAPGYADTVTLATDTSLATNFAPTAPPATQGSLSGGSVTVSGGGGSSSTLSYSEVGSFTLKATPASTYLNTAGVDLAPRVAIFAGPANLRTSWVGRFKPHHFLLSAGTLTNRGAAACAPASSFTYLGEGLDLTFTLTAERSGGGTTANYVGAWAKLDPTVFSNYAVGARSGTTNLSTRVSGAVSGTPAWAGGVLSNVSVRAAVARAAAPDGPWTGTQFGIAPDDGEGTVLTTLDLDVDNNTVNDHAQVGGTTELRFGTLKLDSAYGSELLATRVPVRVLYRTAGGWQTNSDDKCTSFAAATGTLSNYKAPASGPALAPANFSIASNWTSGTVTLGTSPAAGGTADIVFSKPSPTATGSVDLTLDLTSTLPWLLGNWSGVGTAWQQNPAARLSFGSPRSPFIFLREMY